MHEGSDSIIKVLKGESLDFLDKDIFDPATKEEYDKQRKEEALLNAALEAEGHGAL